MGEALNIVKNYNVEQVVFNSGSLVKLEKELIVELDKLNINYDFLKGEMLFQLEKLKCIV